VQNSSAPESIPAEITLPCGTSHLGNGKPGERLYYSPLWGYQDKLKAIYNKASKKEGCRGFFLHLTSLMVMRAWIFWDHS
jgi:hypothetical protein